jgi:glycine/D-amino acid oxidase-like deaminating enzyme
MLRSLLRPNLLSLQRRRHFSDVKSGSKFADIVIVGGGLVGSSLACALAQSPWLSSRKICLLEASPKPAKKSAPEDFFQNDQKYRYFFNSDTINFDY